jgi:GTP-binding protein HflX
MAEQSEAVYTVLRQLHAHEKDVITVLNKIDRLDNPIVLERMKREYPSPVGISALQHIGLEELREAIEQYFLKGCQRFTFHIPYADSGIVTQLHHYGRIISQEYQSEYIEVVSEFNDNQYMRFQNYILEGDK